MRYQLDPDDAHHEVDPFPPDAEAGDFAPGGRYHPTVVHIDSAFTPATEYMARRAAVLEGITQGDPT